MTINVSDVNLVQDAIDRIIKETENLELIKHSLECLIGEIEGAWTDDNLNKYLFSLSKNMDNLTKINECNTKFAKAIKKNVLINVTGE